MCIRIICTDHEHEFSMAEPLEQQIVGAKEIIVNYDPHDPKIDYFVNEVENMIKSGIACDLKISVNTNNCMNSVRLSKKIEKLKMKLDINEVVRKLSLLHSNTDRKLCEISELCLGKTNE